MNDVPADGTTMGEVVMRGNNVMKGYFDDPEATAKAFAGGWFHSGDLGVMHPDGYVRAARPRQGHHHLGRGEHLHDRGRAGRRLAPRPCWRPRSSGCPTRSGASGPRRSWCSARRRAPRRRSSSSTSSRRSPATRRRRRRDRRGAAQDLDRQGPEVRAARGRVGRARPRIKG